MNFTNFQNYTRFLLCAIWIFYWKDFEKFLESHNYITNSLACLVNDGIKHEYTKVVACVCAAFRIHLVIISPQNKR